MSRSPPPSCHVERNSEAQEKRCSRGRRCRRETEGKNGGNCDGNRMVWSISQRLFTTAGQVESLPSPGLVKRRSFEATCPSHYTRQTLYAAHSVEVLAWWTYVVGGEIDGNRALLASPDFAPARCFGRRPRCFGRRPRCFGRRPRCFGRRPRCFGRLRVPLRMELTLPSAFYGLYASGVNLNCTIHHIQNIVMGSFNCDFLQLLNLLPSVSHLGAAPGNRATQVYNLDIAFV